MKRLRGFWKAAGFPWGRKPNKKQKLRKQKVEIMSQWKISLSELDFGAEENEAAKRVLESRWLSMGPETQAFEAEFAKMAGVKHAIAVANGTAALHMVLLAGGVGPGDGVVQPPVNFVASANMTMAVGAVPLFADVVALDEPVISVASAEELLAKQAAVLGGVKPKALIVMHYGGYVRNMAEIKALCDRHGLLLFEDACHAVGARCLDEDGRLPAVKMAGALGDAACFSFFSNKNMATGEGGMITTDRDDLAEKIRRLRSHGMTSLTWDRHRGHSATYEVVANGYNYRIDDLRAALGRAQLSKLENNNERRRVLVRRYWEKLSGLESKGWVFPFKHHFENTSDKSDWASTSCHLMSAVAPDAKVRWQMAEELNKAGIQTSLHYPFIPDFAVFKGAPRLVNLEKSQEFCKRIMTLPLFPTMTIEQVDTVVATMLGK